MGQQLTFSKANAKVRALRTVPALDQYLTERRSVVTFDLLSGWTCPGAKDCRARVIVTEGKRSIQETDDTIYRCFSASQEAAFTSVYDMRQRNFDVLRQMSSSQMVDAIGTALPPRAGIVRLHVSGDFFNRNYFQAWVEVARLHPDRLFYTYTKSLQFWIQTWAAIPENLILTASYGGRHDELIRAHRLRFARVIMRRGQAGRLEIDHDDSHAADPTRRRQSFALLIHGVQPKGSAASAAVRALNGEGSYSRKGY
jgi:hypothetical protein